MNPTIKQIRFFISFYNKLSAKDAANLIENLTVGFGGYNNEDLLGFTAGSTRATITTVPPVNSSGYNVRQAADHLNASSLMISSVTAVVAKDAYGNFEFVKSSKCSTQEATSVCEMFIKDTIDLRAKMLVRNVNWGSSPGNPVTIAKHGAQYAIAYASRITQHDIDNVSNCLNDIVHRSRQTEIDLNHFKAGETLGLINYDPIDAKQYNASLVGKRLLGISGVTATLAIVPQRYMGECGFHGLGAARDLQPLPALSFDLYVKKVKASQFNCNW